MASSFDFRSPLANRFMGTVRKRGLTNPYALAALYSTGKHESGWAPKNVFGEWGDPSESGKPGRAGGALSWRSERLDNLRKFAKSHGDNPRRPSVETQAEFFLNEDPSLIKALQGAKSDVEAQRIMNNAWRFAGYDRPGGEAARRLRTTQQTLGDVLSGDAGSSSMVGSTGSDNTEKSMAIRMGAPGGFSGGYGAANQLGQSVSPAAASPAGVPLQPSRNRSELLAWVLENMREESRRPNPKSLGETGLRALNQGLQGYFAGESMREGDAEEQRKREMIAGILSGTNPEAAELARQGIGGADSWEKAILESTFKEPKEAKAPTRRKNFDEEGREFFEDWNPKTKTWERAGGAKGDSPLVKIDQTGETAFSKERGKQVAEKVGELESQVDASRGLLRDYETIGTLLADPDVYTGTGGEKINALKRAGKTLFGMEMEGVAEAEVAQKVASAAVGKIRQIIGDDRMSDADREFYKNTLPNLNTSPEGIQLSVEVARQATEALAAREAKLAELVGEHQGDAESAWRAFRAWESTQQIWSPELIEQARRVAKEKTVERGPGAGLSPEDRALVDRWLREDQ